MNSGSKPEGRNKSQKKRNYAKEQGELPGQVPTALRSASSSATKPKRKPSRQLQTQKRRNEKQDHPRSPLPPSRRDSAPPQTVQSKRPVTSKPSKMQTEIKHQKIENSDNELCGFEDDSNFLKCLRHLRILPPSPDEHPIRKKIRVLIWWTLFVDFIVALVSVLSYGEATTCCGEAVFSLPGMDLNKVMKILSYIYMIGIIVEIYPVVREGAIPWNLINPVFGFAISFVVFVDDSPLEAITVLVLEVISVVLEFITHRLYAKMVQEIGDQLKIMDQKISERSVEAGYKRNSIHRERRQLRIVHARKYSHLRKHLIGVYINVSLVVLTLILITFVAKSGGMCVYDGGAPDLFGSNQAQLCNACAGKECQVCAPTDDGWNGVLQCYFPFFESVT